MRRVAAVSLLVLTVALVSIVAWDACEGDDCPPGCHLACRDGCATVPVPAAGAWIGPGLLPLRSVLQARADHPLSADPQPELSPPRARS